MKKNYTLITILVCLLSVNYSKATVVVIQASGTGSNQNFTPNVANAVCGDTIRWILISGVHTTASTSVPTGAAPWAEANITSSVATTFSYVVTVAGTYDYTCHPNNGSGGHMDASIVVTCATGVPSVSQGGNVSVYPNPSSGKIMIDLGNNLTSLLDLYNVVGEKVFQSEITSPKSETNLTITDGIYFYELKTENVLIGKGKVIVQK